MIFSVIGFLAHELQVEVKKVVDQGAGLAFIVYPEVVARLPVSPLWSLLFFVMLLTLGLDSQFALMETVTTAILDRFPNLRDYKIWVVLTVAVFGYFGGLIFTTNVSYVNFRTLTFQVLTVVNTKFMVSFNMIPYILTDMYQHSLFKNLHNLSLQLVLLPTENYSYQGLLSFLSSFPSSPTSFSLLILFHFPLFTHLLPSYRSQFYPLATALSK